LTADNFAAADHPEVFATGLDDQLYTLPCDATGAPTAAYALAAPGQIR
jgi:hypothetical protein